MKTTLPPTRTDKSKESSFEELKQRIHSKLVDKLDLSRGRVEGDVLRREIRLVVRTCATRKTRCSTGAKTGSVDRQVLDETFGLGPLEALLKDPSISDILISGPKSVYVERGGAWRRPT